MKISNRGIELIKQFEGCELEAYADIIGVWTIGFGNTYYLDNTKVKKGDKITDKQADELLRETIKGYEIGISKSLKTTIKQNQFDALVCIAYNVGVQAIQKSTLLKLVNKNPNDPKIADEFLKWNKAGGKSVNGLTRRRIAESKLYFSV